MARTVTNRVPCGMSQSLSGNTIALMASPSFLFSHNCFIANPHAGIVQFKLLNQWAMCPTSMRSFLGSAASDHVNSVNLSENYRVERVPSLASGTPAKTSTRCSAWILFKLSLAMGSLKANLTVAAAHIFSSQSRRQGLVASPA